MTFKHFVNYFSYLKLSVLSFLCFRHIQLSVMENPATWTTSTTLANRDRWDGNEPKNEESEEKFLTIHPSSPPSSSKTNHLKTVVIQESKISRYEEGTEVSQTSIVENETTILKLQDEVTKVESQKEATDRLEKSHSNIESLQQVLCTKINVATIETYKQKLPGIPHHIACFKDLDLNENLPRDNLELDFLSRHSFDTALTIKEERSDCSSEEKPNKEEPETQKKWSDVDQHSSESSKSSCAEELETLSSRDSSEDKKTIGQKATVEDCDDIIAYEDFSAPERDDVFMKSKSEDLEIQVLKAIHRRQLENSNRISIVPQRNAYAYFGEEVIMEPNTSKGPKEEKKKKKKSGLRRLLPGFFSPKDTRKEYKKEYRDRRKCDERYFCRYQQNGNYTRSPDSMNLSEDIKRNVALDASEGRLHGRNPNVFTQHKPDDRNIFEDERMHGSYLNRVGPAERYNDDIVDGYKVNQYGYNRENDRKCFLERKHSLQERSSVGSSASGRTSAPPSVRYLIRPRAVHPTDRPLPAIPQRVEMVNYENFAGYAGKMEPTRCFVRERTFDNNDCVMYTTEDARTQVPVRLFSPSKYSPSSSQRSGDYDESTYTANSSQKSEFSPGSSKSGEYYLGSSNCTSPSCFNDKNDQVYDIERQGSPQRRTYPVSPTVIIQNPEDRMYEDTSRRPENESSMDPEKTTNSEDIRKKIDFENIDNSANDILSEDPNQESAQVPAEGDWEGSGRNAPSPDKSLEQRSPDRVKSPNSFRSLSNPDSSRRAQPGDQILIASPKREFYDGRKTSVDDSPTCLVNSKPPLPRQMSQRMDYAGSPTSPMYSSENRKCSSSPCSTCSSCASKNFSNFEPVYSKKEAEKKSPETVTSSDPSLCHSPTTASQKTGSPVMMIQNNRIYVRNESGYLDRQVAQSPSSLSSSSSRTDHSKSPQPSYGQRQVSPMYAQNADRNCPEMYRNSHGQSKQMSKKQTMQELEAFYWQQKALEAQKKESVNVPRAKEAVYWQQLKKMNEEQQKRIYEQHHRPVVVAKMESVYGERNMQNPSRNVIVHRHDSAPNLAVQQRMMSPEPLYWKSNAGQRSQNPANLSTKPPIVNQKVPNQPVLIVRPQQAVQGWQDENHMVRFARTDERRSLSLPRRSIQEMRSQKSGCEVETGRKPPPIFKRGSLVQSPSSSLEYGTVGTKRVSFSNQNRNKQVDDGKWPTKDGMALEPPTRQCKEGDNVYGNALVARPFVPSVETRQDYEETDYDANKPLPPLPRDSYWMTRRCSSMKEKGLVPSQNSGRNGRWRDNQDQSPSGEHGKVIGEKQQTRLDSG